MFKQMFLFKELENKHNLRILEHMLNIQKSTRYVDYNPEYTKRLLTELKVQLIDVVGFD